MKSNRKGPTLQSLGHLTTSQPRTKSQWESSEDWSATRRHPANNSRSVDEYPNSNKVLYFQHKLWTSLYSPIGNSLVTSQQIFWRSFSSDISKPVSLWNFQMLHIEDPIPKQACKSWLKKLFPRPNPQPCLIIPINKSLPPAKASYLDNTQKIGDPYFQWDFDRADIWSLQKRPHFNILSPLLNGNW